MALFGFGLKQQYRILRCPYQLQIMPFPKHVVEHTATRTVLLTGLSRWGVATPPGKLGGMLPILPAAAAALPSSLQ